MRIPCDNNPLRGICSNLTAQQAQIDSLLAAGAIDLSDYAAIDHTHDPVDLSDYVTDAELAAELADYSETTHTHADTANKLVRMESYEQTTKYVTSGTASQNVWSFGYNAIGCDVLEIDWHINLEKRDYVAGGNIAFYAAVTGLSTVGMGQWYHSGATIGVYPMSMIARHSAVAAGYKVVTLQVVPYTANFRFANDIIKPVRAIVREYNY